MEKDVIVIGGGPSGAALSLSLLTHSSLSVGLIDRSDFMDTKIGEHVSSSIFDFLKHLSMDKADFSADCFLPAYESVAYWGDDLPRSVHTIDTFESASYQINREQFDLRLLEEVAERGGDIFPRTTLASADQQSDHSWLLSLKHAEHGAFELKCKYLIDASGRKAPFGRKIGLSPNRLDQLVGVGTFFENQGENAESRGQLIETVEHGWWYSASLPNNLRVVTLFTDSDIVSAMKLNTREQWNALLNETKHIKYEVHQHAMQEAKPWVRDAGTYFHAESSPVNFAAIGDAAISFDPISSMGIGFALSSACHVAYLIASHEDSSQGVLDISQYQKDLQEHFNKYLDVRNKYYEREKRWSDSLFWQRRQQKQEAIQEPLEAISNL
ncbi:lysine-epsilon-oxidase maturase LodB [Aureibacter tunicatorum]|uniref:Flavin-dependent dehydrogenase n=1 Tax=Aureibacter tunicatorum TaxID=866807 RepID=A0AAE4BSI9_9BACT|nr:lysine-epsilon-oxidase maturase LodB [Aureibacter tunicatorum]MDR6238467.1 flavin-dependent dehydrogenase [Aureibacter tunicatorum]BDD05600.1 hypothetical protein AUTU_30830 [Aureibacter tunicatorum]